MGDVGGLSVRAPLSHGGWNRGGSGSLGPNPGTQAPLNPHQRHVNTFTPTRSDWQSWAPGDLPAAGLASERFQHP